MPDTLFGWLRCGALWPPVAERNAFVEHEALAAPAALGLGNVLQIFQDTALEVVDLAEAAREQMRARLFAADAAGAEHRDLAVLLRVEIPRGELLELAERRNVRIERALERAQRHLEGVAGVEHERAGGVDQRIPLGRFDIDANLSCRIGVLLAELP